LEWEVKDSDIRYDFGFVGDIMPQKAIDDEG
jgi:hypothetical protein